MMSLSPSNAQLLALKDEELIERANLSDAEFDQLEDGLSLRAACLGWSGDPMKQPLGVVATEVRKIIQSRSL